MSNCILLFILLAIRCSVYAIIICNGTILYGVDKCPETGSPDLSTANISEPTKGLHGHGISTTTDPPEGSYDNTTAPATMTEEQEWKTIVTIFSSLAFMIVILCITCACRKNIYRVFERARPCKPNLNCKYSGTNTLNDSSSPCREERDQDEDLLNKTEEPISDHSQQ